MSNDYELPVLPLPRYDVDIGGGWMAPTKGFTADQMRQYALLAVQRERERCIAACDGERVAAEETGHAEDIAYNMAVRDCIEAIKTPL